MKKFLLLVMCMVLAVSFTGCVESEETKELLSYVNEDLSDLEKCEAKVIDSYNSALEADDDAQAYEILSTETLDALEEWEKEIREVQDDLKDSKILEVHAIYSSYATKMRNAVVTMMDASETSDMAKVTEANSILDEANKTAAEFNTKLDELGEEYDVEITRK